MRNVARKVAGIGIFGLVFFPVYFADARSSPERIVTDEDPHGAKVDYCADSTKSSGTTKSLAPIALSVIKDLNEAPSCEVFDVNVDDGRVFHIDDDDFKNMINEASLRGERVVEVGAWKVPLCKTARCIFVDNQRKGLEETAAHVVAASTKLDIGVVKGKMLDPQYLEQMGFRKKNFILADASKMKGISSNSVKKLVMKGFLDEAQSEDEKWRVHYGFSDEHLKEYYLEFNRVLSRDGGEAYILSDSGLGEDDSDEAVKRSYRYDIDKIIKHLNELGKIDLKVSHIRTPRMVGIVLRHSLHRSATSQHLFRQTHDGLLNRRQSAPTVIRQRPDKDQGDASGHK